MDPTTKELSYVHPSAKHEFDYDSKVDGPMYQMKSQQIHFIVTPNHKNYVKPRAKGRAQIPQPFQFMEAKDCFGKRLQYKKDCINSFEEVKNIELPDSKGNIHVYPMNEYLKLLGMFISDGSTTNTTLSMAMRKQRKRNYIQNLEEALGINFNYNNSRQLTIGKTNALGIFESFEILSVGALNKYLPDFVWSLGINNCRALLEGLLNGDGSHNLQGSECYYTSSPKLASDVQRLTLHCGYSGTIKKLRDAGYSTVIEERSITTNADTLSVRIVKTKNEPTVNHGHVHQQEIQEEKWVEFSGKVGCFEIPNTHLFYYKKDVLEPPCWTGNSSRSG
jgi:hypothetical protein